MKLQDIFEGKVVYKDPVIIENPTKDQVINTLKKYNNIRGMIVDNKNYIGPGTNMTHDFMLDRISDEDLDSMDLPKYMLQAYFGDNEIILFMDAQLDETSLPNSVKKAVKSLRDDGYNLQIEQADEWS